MSDEQGKKLEAAEGNKEEIKGPGPRITHFEMGREDNLELQLVSTKVDAALGRQNMARQATSIAQKELMDAAGEQDKLIQKLNEKYGADVRQFNIDPDTGKASLRMQQQPGGFGGMKQP